jgi:hypothetical protein
MTEQDTVKQARQAAEVLDNPAYRDALAAMNAQIVEQWKACPVRDAEGALLLLQLAKLAGKVESILRGYIEGGKLAQRKIDLDKERNESGVQRAIRRVL